MNLIVFDIDNTLTKSAYQHQLAYINSMKEIGITKINQISKEYKHHTDSYIVKVNYKNNLSDKFDFKVLKNFEKIISTFEPVKEINGAKNFVYYLRNEKNTL